MSRSVRARRQRDNDMKNSLIRSQNPSLSRRIPFGLINVSVPSSGVAPRSPGFSIPGVIECAFFTELRWPLIKHIKSSSLIGGHVRRPTCGNQLDDKQ